MRSLSCSFCGKSQNQVARLIAGPTVYICNECVLLCVDILNEDVAYEVDSRPPEDQGSERDESIYESVLVHLPHGVTVAVEPLRYWTPFVHEGELLEWAAGRAPWDELVVGVRKRGYTGAALGLSFPVDRDPTEDLARSVPAARRAAGGADSK